MRPGTLLVILFSVLCLSVVFVFASRGAGAANPKDGMFWNEDVARYVRRKVANSYVDQLDEEGQRQAFYRAMNGYVDLDPYCEFIPPEEHKGWREDIEGKYAGLGIKIEEVPEGLALIGVLPGGPAARAGLKVGDTLVRADEFDLAGIEFEDVTKVLKGRPNTQVRVTYLPGPRPDDGPPPGPVREVVVTRGVVRPPTVFSRRVGDQKQFGLLRLEDFAEETADEFHRRLDEMIGDGIQGILIDLRGNGGGVLAVALKVADRFLDRGLILRMEGRGPDSNKNHVAHADADDVKTLPLIVLVNGGSASASEVVAGALQDHRRALLVGERTYGKFLVQQISEVPGTKAAVKLTTSRYYTPSGRSYQISSRRPPGSAPEPAGLFPDVIVPLDEDQARDLARFWYDEEGGVWGTERRFEEISVDWVDPQLERALKLLSGEVALRSIRRSGPRHG